jgi:hypothetical protein
VVIRNDWCVTNYHNPKKRRPSGDTQLSPGARYISVPAGNRHSSQAGSSIASTIQGQISTPSFSENNCSIAYVTHHGTSTCSATQRCALSTPTTTPRTTSYRAPAPGGTWQTDSTHRIVSNPASAIAITPTPLSSLENLPTPILNPEAHAIITNPLRIWATKRNQRER